MWTPIDLLNFAFVPVRHQLLINNLGSLVESGVLSLIRANGFNLHLLGGGPVAAEDGDSERLWSQGHRGGAFQASCDSGPGIGGDEADPHGRAMSAVTVAVTRGDWGTAHGALAGAEQSLKGLGEERGASAENAQGVGGAGVVHKKEAVGGCGCGEG